MLRGPKETLRGGAAGRRLKVRETRGPNNTLLLEKEKSDEIERCELKKLTRDYGVTEEGASQKRQIVEAGGRKASGGCEQNLDKPRHDQVQ